MLNLLSCSLTQPLNNIPIVSPRMSHTTGCTAFSVQEHCDRPLISRSLIPRAKLRGKPILVSSAPTPRREKYQDGFPSKFRTWNTRAGNQRAITMFLDRKGRAPRCDNSVKSGPHRQDVCWNSNHFRLHASQNRVYCAYKPSAALSMSRSGSPTRTSASN